MNYIDPCCGPRFSWAHHVSPGARCADHIPQCGTVAGWSSMLELSSPSRTPLDLSKDGGYMGIQQGIYNMIQPISWGFTWHLKDHLWPHSSGKYGKMMINNPWGDLMERRFLTWNQRPGTQWYAAGSSGSPLCNAPARCISRCPWGNDHANKKGSDMTPSYTIISKLYVVNPIINYS